MSNCFGADSESGAEVLNNIVRMLPGVPENEARTYMAQALRRFARTSKLWTSKDYEVEVKTGDQFAEVIADAGIDVQSIDKVLIANGMDCWQELEPGNEVRCLEDECADGDNECETPELDPADFDRMNQVWEADSSARGRVRFGRPFRDDQRLRFHVTLAPSIGSNTFPQHLIDDNQDAIEAGSVSFGYLIPGQEWSNAEAGLLYRGIWNEALALAKQEQLERDREAAPLPRLDLKSRLLNNIVRMLPGAPELEVREYMNNALRQFARTSGLWTYKDYEVAVCAGDQVTEIQTGDGVEVESVDAVYVQEAADECGCAGDPHCWKEIRQGDETQCLPFDASAGSVCGRCGGGEWLYQAWEATHQQRGQVRFAREWQYPARIRFHLTLTPAEGCDAFPKHLLESNQQAIETGALAFAYMIPGQEWSNAKLGAYYMQQWELALRDAAEKKRQRQLRTLLDMPAGRPAYCSPGYSRECR